MAIALGARLSMRWRLPVALQKLDWVVDLDIRVSSTAWTTTSCFAQCEAHRTVVGAPLREGWLEAPLNTPDGTISARERGTPQGSAVSPLLANLFLHYAFDMWLSREFPDVSFERYADDAVVHCARRSRHNVSWKPFAKGWRVSVWSYIRRRPASCTAKMRTAGVITITSASTSWDTCFVAGRCGARPGRSSTASPPLSATRPPRRSASRSDAGGCIIALRPRSVELARRLNPIVRGWINYYGHFYRSWLARCSRPHQRVLGAMGAMEIQTAEQSPSRSWRWLEGVSSTFTGPLRTLADRGAALTLDDGSRMSREAHVRF